MKTLTPLPLALWLAAALLCSQPYALAAPPAPQPSTPALAAVACRLPSSAAAVSAAAAPTASPSISQGASMQRTAPTTSPHLDTLDIVRIGLSLDVYRQGQAWAQLQKQNTAQPQALLLGTALPTDPRDYPTDGTDMDIAWGQRIANALELALQGFPERWPIPTVTVVRDYDPKMERPRVRPEAMEDSLVTMVSREIGNAGLHWHDIRQLDHGVVCRTNPEALVESIFQLFERSPDLPALLVYAVDGFNMRAALSSKNVSLKSIIDTGPRKPTTAIDAVVAMVVARPERVDWLRYFAPYTQTKPNSIDPRFMGWQREPRIPFSPSPFFAKPITEKGFQQWDRLRPLARLHRPLTVALTTDKQQALKGPARDKALASGWDRAIAQLGAPVARVFYDTGKLSGGVADLAPAMLQAQSPVDLLDSQQNYDLSQRLGDIGAASPFVGLALATMASYTQGDYSMVLPLRQSGQATFIGISPPQPGQRPQDDPFDVKLRPQHTAVTNEPSPEHLALVSRRQREWRLYEDSLTPPYRDPQILAQEQRILNDFIAGLPGDAPAPKKP